MTATRGDQPAAHHPEQEQRALGDVTHERLIDLIDNRDPLLAASVRELTAMLDRSVEVRLGWQSAIPEE